MTIAVVGRDPDGTAGPHVFVDDVEKPVLHDHDRHHLARVVRLRTGDPLTIGDGKGNWRLARFGECITGEGDIIRVAREHDPITVGFALIKGSRTDDVVRHLTELGVDAIVPMHTERCVVRWSGTNAATHHDRLIRIAREAAMQCRRAWLPVVEPVTKFDEVVQRLGAVVAQMGAPPLAPGTRTLLIGPEGGWSATEQDLAHTTASIGDHVLRAETAALSAGALLAANRRAAR